MEFLPSKRFVVTAVLILAAFAGWFFVFGPRNNSTSDSKTSSDTLISVSTASSTAAGQSLQVSPDTNDAYLRLEGVVYPPSRLGTIDESASSTVAFKSYGLELVQSLALYGEKSRVDEISLLASALQKGSAKAAQTELLGLVASKQIHTAVREKLTAQRVPPSFKELHAELITSVSRIEQLVENMSTPFENPTLALASAEEYIVETARMREALGAINDLFREKGVTFTEKEKATVVLYEVQ